MSRTKHKVTQRGNREVNGLVGLSPGEKEHTDISDPRS